MNAIILNICKIGQGSKSCKYLVISDDGFKCLKINPKTKEIVDRHARLHQQISQGDNCDGKNEIELNKNYENW